MPDPDTSNKFLVGYSPPPGPDLITTAPRACIIIQSPKINARLTKPEAVNLAAWLVAIADPTRAEFDQTLRAIMTT